jgi:hypothetical protein
MKSKVVILGRTHHIIITKENLCVMTYNGIICNIDMHESAMTFGGN